MPNGLLTSLLAEPAVADPPRRVWRDWILAAAMAIASIVEGLVRDEVTWRPFTTVVVAALAATMLWRRSSALAMTAIGFGSVMVLDQLARATGHPPLEFYSAGFIVILPYALFRWASGRHAAWGAGIMLLATVSSLVTNWTGVGDAIGGAFVLAFPAVLGVEVRHLVGSQARRRHDIQIEERAMLARELHDTVAHHVSAIAIRAQAGRVVGATDPAGALDALAVIEREASRTLAEMRGIVGTLRGGDDAEFAPQPGLADISRLATPDERPRIQVDVQVDARAVGDTAGAALFRIAQESVTNARRHALGATVIQVVVRVVDDAVTLTVDDDGRAPGSEPHGAVGFGLVGMTERAHLLGGSFHAGPRSAGGWRVTAMLPLNERVA